VARLREIRYKQADQGNWILKPLNKYIVGIHGGETTNVLDGISMGDQLFKKPGGKGGREGDNQLEKLIYAVADIHYG